MTDNVRKIFDILGVEPNEKFKVEGNEKIYFCDETLSIYGIDGVKYLGMLSMLLTGEMKITKSSKEPKKKKLRDFTPEDYKRWRCNNCARAILSCEECIFDCVNCDNNSKKCWVNNKDLYSDKFLDQELEVEE